MVSPTVPEKLVLAYAPVVYSDMFTGTLFTVSCPIVSRCRLPRTLFCAKNWLSRPAGRFTVAFVCASRVRSFDLTNGEVSVAVSDAPQSTAKYAGISGLVGTPIEPYACGIPLSNITGTIMPVPEYFHVLGSCSVIK